MPAHPNMAEPDAGPVGDEGPGAVPPMSNEIPDRLINDDLLGERLLRKMQNSLKWVYIHHKVMFFLETRSTLHFGCMFP